MNYHRVLTIQDISCVGQCSMTVALPILSACGQETAVLPSAVLSTHTGGFTGFTVRDLSDDFPGIQDFRAIYTGYLGSLRQIDMVKDIFATMIEDGGLAIVDPAMGDHGKLYPGFDQAYADAMGTLCGKADIIIPNITEACYMTGHPYAEDYDEAYVMALVEKLKALGAKCVVLTGVGYEEGKTGVLVSDESATQYYCHKRIPKNYHGTGDIFASAFVGAHMLGKSLIEAAQIAADYTAKCIELTIDDDSHWYGVKFEAAIPDLVKMLYA